MSQHRNRSAPAPLRRPPAWLVYVVLALGTMAVYWPVHQYEFTRWDDDVYITNNPWLRQGLKGIGWAFTSGYAANWHPLTWLSHMVDVAVFDFNAGAHHLVSLGFHVVNTLLLFGIWRRMTGAFWRSALVAALFAWHPLHVESVAWVAERKDVLSGFFWILSLGAYVRYAEQPHARRYVLLMACFMGGLLSKPMVVTLPFVLLLLDYWPLERWRRRGMATGSTPPRFALRSTRQLLLEKLPLLPMIVASSLVTYWVQLRGGAMEAAESYPMPLRVANALVAYLRYLGKTFWPTDLAVLYPWRAAGWPAVTVTVAVCLLAGMTLLAVLRRKREPYVLVGWLWFLGTLVPVIGLVQVGSQAMADRYTYLPHIGLFTALVWSVANASTAGRWPRSVMGAAIVAVLMACLAATSRQLPQWQNTLTLFERTLAHTTANPIAELSLGLELQSQGRADEALPHLRTVLRIAPDLFLRHVRHTLGGAEAHRHLAVVLTALGQFGAALTNCQASLALNPTNAETHLLLGRLLAEQRRPDEAIHHYAESLHLAPTNTEARLTLAFALDARRRDAEASEQYRAVLETQPAHLQTLNNYAWILATHPDPGLRNGAKAVELAARASELSAGTNAVYQGTLAAAFAEVGRFADAAATAEAAADRARQLGVLGLEATLRKHVQRYQAGQPCREEF